MDKAQMQVWNPAGGFALSFGVAFMTGVIHFPRLIFTPEDEEDREAFVDRSLTLHLNTGG